MSKCGNGCPFCDDCMGFGDGREGDESEAIHAIIIVDGKEITEEYIQDSFFAILLGLNPSREIIGQKITEASILKSQLNVMKVGLQDIVKKDKINVLIGSLDRFLVQARQQLSSIGSPQPQVV